MYNNKSKVEQIAYVDGKQKDVRVTYQLTYNDDGEKASEKYYDDAGNPVRGRTWFYNNKKEIDKSYAREES